jgi:hypothetical protein
MQKLPAKLISWLFHPLIIPFLGSALVLLSGHYLVFFSTKLVSSILLIFFAFTFALPLLLLPLLYYQRLIPDLSLKNNTKRRYVYLIVLIIYTISAFLMHYVEFPQLLRQLMLAYAFLAAGLILLSFLVRISVHTAAIASLSALTFALILRYDMELHLLFLAGILLSGIIASSRLALKYHKPWEVYLGFVYGFAGMLLIMLTL